MSTPIRYGTILLCVALTITYYRKISIQRDDVWLILITAFILINNQDVANEDFSYIVVYIAVLLAYLVFRENLDFVNICCNMLIFFGTIYAIMTFVCYAFPNLYLSQILPLFSQDTQAKLMISFNRGAVSGIAKHYSLNAFYILLGILGCVAKVFRNEKISKKYMLLVAVLAVALLLTGKRGHIVFGAAAIIVQYYFYNTIKKFGRIFKIICLIIAVLILFLVLRNFIPGINLFVERFIETSESDNVTMGRDALYLFAFSLFKENPVFGVGWGGFVYKYEALTSSVYATHNIYLSLLCETGIVGFIVFILWFIRNIVDTIRTYISARNFKIANEYLYIINFSLMYQVTFLLLGISENPLYDIEAVVPYFISLLALKQVKRELTQCDLEK